jgi:sialic acid synthase SpsE/mannose-6-phosphate isomerase-like protein (cupin superfamily)
MKSIESRPLFIFEMANNHMGRVDHALAIIDALHKVVRDFPFAFAVKLQYRSIEDGIHPAYRDRFDLKFVKRFSETRLSWEQYQQIKEAIDAHGFISICTPWDEVSVDRIVEHGYDFLKVPSCYLTDWPLLEKIVRTDLPIIASTAGVQLRDIDRVVSFFRHRQKKFSLMHCVGQYPTPDDNLQLNQIELLRNRYGNVEVGYSTHERPGNVEAVKIAVGMGARMFEKHVGLEAPGIQLNAYSANPEQVRNWLEAASQSLAMCGVAGERYAFGALEVSTLKDLQRGVFVRQDLPAGARLTGENTFYAMPAAPGQIRANDMSKYVDFTTAEPLAQSAPALTSNTRSFDRQEYVFQIVSDVRELLQQAKVVVPGELDLEISHHYGIGRFREYGSTTITVVNREYCKRVIVMLPGQTHPEQFHKLKDETYHILHGNICLKLDGVARPVKANEVVVIPRGVKHAFTTTGGAVIEEVSSHYSQGDSYYVDSSIEANTARKTLVTYWMDWAMGRPAASQTSAAGQ